MSGDQASALTNGRAASRLESKVFMDWESSIDLNHLNAKHKRPVNRTPRPRYLERTKAAMSHEISPISTAVDVRVLTMGPKVSGFLLGFNLDDEVNVIPNRSQKSIHAKVGAFESAAGFFPTLFTTTLSVTGLEDNAKANRDMAVR